MIRRHTLRRLVAAAPLCAALVAGGCTAIGTDSKAALTAQKEVEAEAAKNDVALKLARAARDAGDMTSAVNLYTSAIEHKPDDMGIMVELGEAQLGAGTIDGAIETFNKVNKKSSARLGALLGLERAYLMLREPTKALTFADAAVARAPKDKRAQIGQGVAMDMLGRHAEAQLRYRKAIAIDPYDVAARSDLALSLALTGQYDEAIKIMTPIARAPDATPRLRQNLALIYGLKGDMAAARALSRVDLNTAQTNGNLRFFALVRAKKK